MAQGGPGEALFQVETLNTWGLWLVSKRRRQRMQCLAQHLRKTSADVVFLQEVWVRADARLLQEGAALGGLQHAVHFQAGTIGCGLLILSRHPIQEAGFHPFSARGDPFRVLNGDFFAGKGVGWAALRTPVGVVDAFNTHLSANYQQLWLAGEAGLPCRVPRDGYAGVRLLQVLELAAYVRGRATPAAAGAVLAGDLNAAPDTLEIALLQALLPELRDTWAELHPDDAGPTANSPLNTFATAGAGHKPIRIDYVWSTGRPIAAAHTLQDAGCGFSFSDHMGVGATISLEPCAGRDAQPDAAAAVAAATGAAATPAAAQQADASPAGPSSCPEEQVPAPAPGGQQGACKGACQAGGSLQEAEEASKGEERQEEQAQEQERGAPVQQSCQASIRRAAAEQQGTAAASLNPVRPAPEKGPLLTAVHRAVSTARGDMERGAAAAVAAAALLWVIGFASLAALLASPWRHYRAEVLLVLVCTSGVAFGWAGVVFVGGFVGRGVEAAALRQVELQLRLLAR